MQGDADVLYSRKEGGVTEQLLCVGSRSGETVHPDEDQMHEIFRRRMAECDRLIAWYHGRMFRYGTPTKLLRWCGIIGIGIASLWPVVQLIGSDAVPSQLGYLSAALGGLALGVERYSGLATGWIRSARAAVQLEKLRDSLDARWAMAAIHHAGDEEALRKARCSVLEQSVGELWDVVTRETEEWAGAYISDLTVLRGSMAEVDPNRKGGRPA